MKRYVQKITAAAEGDSKLQMMIDQIEDDFDYLIAGLEKLDRDGATSSNEGLMIAEKFSQALQSAIEAVANQV